MKLRYGAVATVLLGATLAAGNLHAGSCSAEQPQPLQPTNLTLCRSLDDAVRHPSALSLDQYEDTLNQYFSALCHRDEASGWLPDKRMRDTGPFVSVFAEGRWKGAEHGTHGAVVIWYSPEMVTWMKANRTEADRARSTDAEPVPAGAIMVKEMYDAPATQCAGVAVQKLKPSSHGAAIMVRDPDGSHDGWFWGWYGWPGEGWAPDWPAPASNALPNMGFGQYCTNCHASARDNDTFASVANMKGGAGEPLPFLVQSSPVPDQANGGGQASTHARKAKAAAQPLLPIKKEKAAADSGYTPGFTSAIPRRGQPPSRDDIVNMPSQTYDTAFMPAISSMKAPASHAPFLTSDQCLGCHDAGSTGLQFDMTVPALGNSAITDPDLLLNLSPYATWRTSPMGLAGRDPIFFGQLASETQSFHPESADLVQGTCFGCHGVLGQRQMQNSAVAAGEVCEPMLRDVVNSVPYPDDNPNAKHADFGALARDGISCMACHQMVLGDDAEKAALKNGRNACIQQRRDLLNPDSHGFARNFTGSFTVGDGDRINGPFADPKTVPMEQAIGVKPVHDATVIASSEMCGSCHTVHLPVLRNGDTLGHVFEQTTYAEWAFSAYRTGESPYGKLPDGAGSRSEACVGCHLRDGAITASRVASIQSYSDFPAADFSRMGDEIDLAVRDNYAPHVLVGLNLFLVSMAQQFPDILGLRAVDPMLVSKGVNPADFTADRMTESAASQVARVAVDKVIVDGSTLKATVSVESLVGHKFPSGVGFRRAFIEFDVLDSDGNVIWASGRTDDVGRIIDGNGQPIAGEDWWSADCAARIAPDKRLHQPHYQTVSAESQAQIYQELVAAPPATGEATCGIGATPSGPLTTSFLSICANVKDNRLLPAGFLDVKARTAIAEALGSDSTLALETGPHYVNNDPDYVKGGGDHVDYVIPFGTMRGNPASVQARLYYQATPPFYLQDRSCTAQGPDTDRLYYLAGNLDLSKTRAKGWKLLVGEADVQPLN